MKDLKKLIADKDYASAVSRIRAKLSDPKLDSNGLTNLAKVASSIPAGEFISAGFLPKKVAVLSGYTTQYLSPLLRAELLKSGIYAELFETEYGLFEQAILSEDEALKSFQPDLLYFCVGSENIELRTGHSVENEANRWTALWTKARETFSCEIIQNTFIEPSHRSFGNLDFKRTDTPQAFVRRLNAKLSEMAPTFVHFADVNFLASQIGRANFIDEKLYDLSKTPASFDHLPAYAECVASVAAALYGKKKKCLVLDLDNTLWGGVIGDDGLAHVAIGPDSGVGEGFLRFQKYVKALKERGVILAVCSKNDEHTAKEPFTARTEMVLKLEDISCFMANWEPKSQNILKIAKTLNIGLDSLVFVDDNPTEREIIRQQLPEVTVIELPEDPAEYTAALSRTYHFDPIHISSEDMARSSQYQANAEREELLANSTDYPKYLQSLNMKAVVAPFDAPNLGRITQLVNKTNQFNVTTRRYTDADTSSFAEDPKVVTYYVKMKDRFGDNGLISVFVGKQVENDLMIDTWLMSCRVLKKGVEDLLFQNVLRSAMKRGMRKIVGEYLPTAKNGMVKDLYRDFGFTLEKELTDGGTRWTFDLTNPENVEKALAKPVYVEIEPVNA